MRPSPCWFPLSAAAVAAASAAPGCGQQPLDRLAQRLRLDRLRQILVAARRPGSVPDPPSSPAP